MYRVQKMLMTIMLTINIAGNAHAMQLTQENKNKKLFAAIQKRGGVEDARGVIEQGAQVNAKDEDGNMPLHKVVRYGHVEVTRLLLDQGAQVDAIKRDGGTPLHGAAWDGRTKIAQLFLDRGAQVDAKNNAGMTPLHNAALMGHPKVVQLLLDRGAQVNEKDGKDKTPLHKAVLKGHVEVVQQLLDQGAVVDAGNWILFVDTTSLGSDDLQIIPILAAYDDEDRWKKVHPDIKKGVQDCQVTPLMLKRYHDLRLQWNDAFYEAQCMSKDAQIAAQELECAAEKIADLKVPKLSILARRLGLQNLNLHQKRLPAFYPLPQQEAILNQVEQSNNHL